MKAHSQMPADFRMFCKRFSQNLEKLSGYEARLDYIKKEFPGLLANKSFFSTILNNVANGAAYPDIREATMFTNEILLYADEKRLFSIRIYLWKPGEFTPAHDHSAWGVIGSVSGDLGVIKYSRNDDGSRKDYADLVEKQKLTLSPGEFDVVLPLNKGIHKTGNLTDTTSLTVHLYGNPIRRPYINRFDLDTGRIYRMYSPRTEKRMLASEALRDFGNPNFTGD